MDDEIDMRDYPLLRQVAWHITGLNHVPAKQAFALIEANWAHVRVEHLTDREIALIRRLALECGAGIFAPHGGQPIFLEGVHCA